jgi:type III restriction enzyme
MILTRDENIYKPIRLVSEFIRRKRELTRLSGDFKKCVFEASAELMIVDTVNTKVTNLQKTIGVNGSTATIDAEQTIKFNDEREIYKDLKEVFDSYDRFCSDMSAPYAKARSTNIIKSALRSLFKEKLSVGNEDLIATVAIHPSNNPYIKQLLTLAKDKYKNLPDKAEEVVTNHNWEVPEEISIYTDTQVLVGSQKSLIKQKEARKLFVKKNKNGKMELSNPEIDFIGSLDATDDDILWWYKNSHGESKYFSIAYKKSDGHYYGFYPDFIIRTKKETLIVEIKDDRDFKVDNALKLQAGKDYVNRFYSGSGVRFWILSPQDYFNFFKCLKEQNVHEFKSIYEQNLTKLNLSQKLVLENKQDKTESESEMLGLLNDFERTLQDLDQLKEYNSYLEQSLDEAQRTVNELTKSYYLSQKNEAPKQYPIITPLQICILGEVSNQQTMTHELNDLFTKLGLSPNNWGVDYYDNRKLKQPKTLKTLIKGQSKYDLIITGQIHSHALPGNTKSNIVSELNNEKYVDHIVGCDPKDVLTTDRLLSVLCNYLTELNGRDQEC